MTYIDKCLWEYKANLAAIDWLKDEVKNLLSLSVQSYEQHEDGGVSDPVGELVIKKQTYERKIQELERKTQPITRLYDELTGNAVAEAQMKEILKLRFFDHESRNTVTRKLSISSATYDRRCQAVKQIARRYFGDAKRS